MGRLDRLHHMSTLSVYSVTTHRLLVAALCSLSSVASAATYSDAAKLVGIDQVRTNYPTITGSGCAIAILDSGINANHVDFAGRIVVHKNAQVVAMTDLSGNSDQSATSHGTVDAGIAAGAIAEGRQGVAPGAKLVVLRVFGSSLGTVEDVNRALKWVKTNALTYGIVAVNMSLGFGSNTTNAPNYALGDPLYETSGLIKDLAGLGVTCVAASGNFYRNYASEIVHVDWEGSSFPASDRYAIGVGGVFANTSSTSWLHSGGTSYSSRADQLTASSQRHRALTWLFAPGARITAPARGSTLATTTHHGGTSQATPFVAGAVALIQQAAQNTLRRRLSFSEVKGILRASADVITDSQFTPDRDNVFNCGYTFARLNVNKAVQRVMTLATNTPPVFHGINGATSASSTAVTLAAAGYDADGQITWSWTSSPVAASVVGGTTSMPTFILNKVGTYTFTAKAVSGGVTVIKQHVCTVNPVVTSLELNPEEITLDRGRSYTFTASVRDQFNKPMSVPLTWTCIDGGTITSSGTFTAPNAAGDICIRAKYSNRYLDYAYVTVP